METLLEQATKALAVSPEQRNALLTKLTTEYKRNVERFENPNQNRVGIYLTREVDIDISEYQDDRDETGDDDTIEARRTLALHNIVPQPSWELVYFDKQWPKGFSRLTSAKVVSESNLSEIADEAITDRESFYLGRVEAYGLSALPKDTSLSTPHFINCWRVDGNK